MSSAGAAIRDLLAEAPVVIDGGLGTLLEQRGNGLDSDLWSARLLLDRPQEVVAAHRAFFDSGARVAISCSYQASFEGMERVGLTHADTARLLRRSVALARQAADEARVPGLVAASVGPYGAMLADGSEYRGDYGLSVQELRDWHRPRMAVLADSGADVLALETVPNLAETEAVVAEADRLGVPAWLAVTADGGRLRSGESMEEAYRIASSAPGIVAVGVNCSAPEEVAAAIDAARRAGAPAVLAYPNSGEIWDATAHRWTGEPRFADALLADWVTSGVSAVGGCCRVLPRHIAHIAAEVGRLRRTG